MIISFTIPGRWLAEKKRTFPVGKGENLRVLRVDTQDRIGYKEHIIAQTKLVIAEARLARPLDEPLQATYIFRRPKPKSYRTKENRAWKRPDVTNLAKILEDALQDAGLFRDDAAIWCSLVVKEFGPRWEIEVNISTDEDWPYRKEPADDQT